jgi:predicted nucleotidyltransferase
MRLNPDIADFLKIIIQEKIPGSTVFLFGSRTDDKTKGGDIDLMILTDEPVDKRTFRMIRVEFVKRWGWQKLDLVNFTHSDKSPFRKLIDKNCIPL